MTDYVELGYTSDHVWRTICVGKPSGEGEIYMGFTWNLLERCYSKVDGTGRYANNPLSITENIQAYLVRKLKQISEIVDLCFQSDFGLLQETDFLFPEYYTKKDEREKLPKEFIPIFEHLKTVLVSTLKVIGWHILYYEDKEMAIIYSSNLEYVDGSITTHLEYKSKLESKKVLFCADFMDRRSKQHLTLGTLHGNFNSDYSLEIPQLMKELQSDNGLVIFGGNTNHPPSYKIDGLLVVNPQECTNFCTNYSECDEGFTKVYLHDDREDIRDQYIIKAYDGFFVVPPSKEKVSVMVGGHHVWEKEVSNNVEYVKLVSTYHTHCEVSDRGKPIFRSDAAKQLFA